MQYAKQSIPDLLKRFIRFESKPQAERLTLAESVDIQIAQAGTKLFRAGDTDDIDFFLVSGELKLIAEDGRSHILRATSDAARHPVSRLRPRRYTAVADTRVEYFVAAATVAADASVRSQPARFEAIDVMEISVETYESAVASFRQQKAASYS
jgi:CRP-like cAMP-binding protein